MSGTAVSTDAAVDVDRMLNQLEEAGFIFARVGMKRIEEAVQSSDIVSLGVYALLIGQQIGEWRRSAFTHQPLLWDYEEELQRLIRVAGKQQ